MNVHALIKGNRMVLRILVVAVAVVGPFTTDRALGSEESQQLARLPAGNGIAAEYRGDRGIARHDAVVFADDFENTLSTGDLRDRWTWTIHEGQMSIAEESRHVNSGRRALAISMPQQASALSVEVAKQLDAAQNVLFLRWYSKYEDGFLVPGGSVHNGGSISSNYYDNGRATPGRRADGRNKFLVNYESENSSGQSPGMLNIYCYHPEQGGDFGDHFYPSGRVLPMSYSRSGSATFGSHFSPRPEVIPELGRWHCYEYMVKANTPGLRDGRIACWLDGQLVADFPNLRLRDTASLKIDRFGIGLYVAKNTARANTKWYDDVVAATRYIGPRVPEPSQ